MRWIYFAVCLCLVAVQLSNSLPAPAKVKGSIVKVSPPLSFLLPHPSPSLPLFLFTLFSVKKGKKIRFLKSKGNYKIGEVFFKRFSTFTYFQLIA